MKTLRDVVADRLAEIGERPIPAAEKAGLQRNYLHDIVAGKKKTIRENYLGQMAEALQWPYETLVNQLKSTMRQTLSPGRMIQSFDPDAQTGEDFSDDREAISDLGLGLRAGRRLERGTVLEIDHSLSGGHGDSAGISSAVSTDSHGNSFYAEHVRAEWQMPIQFLESELGLNMAYAEIVRIKNNSMEPYLFEGDRVIVDRRDKSFRNSGIFAIRDGDDLVVKQVEFMRDGPETRILCKPFNPEHPTYTLSLEDGSADIIGRVVLRIGRLNRINY